jgi:hypothetical protein
MEALRGAYHGGSESHRLGTPSPFFLSVFTKSHFSPTASASSASNYSTRVEWGHSEVETQASAVIRKLPI